MGVVTIQSLDAASGSIKGGNVVTVTGTGFTPASTVKIGGVAATVLSRTGSTKMTVLAPPHAAMQVILVVTNPDEGTSYKTYTYAK